MVSLAVSMAGIGSTVGFIATGQIFDNMGAKITVWVCIAYTVAAVVSMVWYASQNDF